MSIRLVFPLVVALMLFACQSNPEPGEEAAPQLPGRAFRVTGYGSRGGSSDLIETSGARIVRATDGSSTPAPSTDMPNWPRLSKILRGPCALKITNVNECDIRVGFRDGAAGRDILIPMGSEQETTLPGGRYSLYVQYATEPGVLYEGPSVRVGGEETVVEILPPR